MSGHSSKTGITAPGSFDGLPAHEAARVHITTEMDRKQLKKSEQEAEINPVYNLVNVRNLDIVVRDPCFTIVKKSNQFHKSPMSETHAVSVMSSLNGMGAIEARRSPRNEEACIRALMQRMRFIGFALDNVYYTPEFGGFNMSPTDVGVHISGVYTLRAVEDMPLGAWVRLRPPTQKELMSRDAGSRTNDGRLGSKVILEPRPEIDGRPFAMRVLNDINMFIQEPHVYMELFSADTDKSDAQTAAIAAMVRSVLLNFICVANTIRNHADDSGASMGLGAFDPVEAASKLGLLANELTPLGVKAVKSCFFDMSRHFTLGVGYNPQQRNNPNIAAGGRAATSPGGKLLLMQQNNHIRAIAGMCDMLRIDAEWIVGRVIRQAKTNGGFDLFG